MQQVPGLNSITQRRPEVHYYCCALCKCTVNTLCVTSGVVTWCGKTTRVPLHQCTKWCTWCTCGDATRSRSVPAKKASYSSALCSWLSFYHSTQMHRPLPYFGIMPPISVAQLNCLKRAKSWREMSERDVVHYTSPDYCYYFYLWLKQ